MSYSSAGSISRVAFFSCRGLLFAIGLAAARLVQAQGTVTLLNDTFASGSRSVQNLPASAAWYQNSGTASNLTVQNGALTAVAGSSASTLWAYFPGVSLNANEAVTLSVTFSFSVPTASGGWRLGLCNTNGVAPSTTDGSQPRGNYQGYGNFVTWNGSSGGLGLLKRNGPSASTAGADLLDSVGAGATAIWQNLNAGGVPPAFASFAANTTYTGTLTILRTGADSATISATISGGGQNFAATEVDSSGALTHFDTLAIALNGGTISGNLLVTKATITVVSLPAFSAQPASQSVVSGSTVVFNAAATGSPTYQWRLNGTNIAGATSAQLVVTNAQAANVAAYTVVATNAAGAVTSNPAALSVVSATSDPGRLINLSILTSLAAGESMTIGTVLGGVGTSGSKPLLARAAGPSLAPLGLSGFLPDPTMALVSTSVSPSVTVAANNDWGGVSLLANAFTAVGAFAYASPASKDAAIFQPSLAPGNYTVQVGDAGTGSGTVIAELYDASGTAYTFATPRLVNVSVLKQIATGGSLTAGFVVGGSTAKTVLVRAVGPTLGVAPFGLGGTMPDPQLKLFNGAQAVVAINDDWGGDAQIVSTASRVGAFALSAATSKDAVILFTLAPGSYTAQVSPASGTAGGSVIVEVYEVP